MAREIKDSMTTETKNICRCVAPFATWIGLQTLLPATAWAYAARTAATALVALILAFRRADDGRSMWQIIFNSDVWAKPVGGGAPRNDHLSPFTFHLSLFFGLLVTVLWIAPEFSDFYRTWFCWPIGSLPAPSADPSTYAPAVCGWTLTIVKLIGSAFVIAPVEELFFRSFLYRWLQRRDFLSVPLSRFDLSAFLWMIFLFTLEHDRPLAAALAGAIYGLLAIRVNLASAIVAHVTTNLLLALYVIHQNAWAFW